MSFAHLGDDEGQVALDDGNFAVHMVQVLVVSTQVTTLSEAFRAEFASEWARRRVLAEMVAQVAALAEDCGAVGVLALEVQLDALGHLVAHLDHLVPIRRNPIILLHEGRGVCTEQQLFLARQRKNRTSVRVRFKALSFAHLVELWKSFVKFQALVEAEAQLRQNLGKSVQKWFGLADHRQAFLAFVFWRLAGARKSSLR